MCGSINNDFRSVVSTLTKNERPLISVALSSSTVKPLRISSTDCCIISLFSELTRGSSVGLDGNWSRNDFKTVETSDGFKSLDSFARCAMDSQAGWNKAKVSPVTT